MAVGIDDCTHHSTFSIHGTVGVSSSTLFRSVEEGMTSDLERQDWRGSRLLTLAQIKATSVMTNHVFGLVEAASRIDL
jgi:hypothetical protein